MRHCPNPDCPHLALTGRVAELRDDIELCPDCGQPTSWGPPPDESRNSRAESPVSDEPSAGLVKVAEFTTLHEAEMARQMLRAYDIDAELTDRHVTGMGLPLHALGVGLHLVVPADREDEALALLTPEERRE